MMRATAFDLFLAGTFFLFPTYSIRSRRLRQWLVPMDRTKRLSNVANRLESDLRQVVAVVARRARAPDQPAAPQGVQITAQFTHGEPEILAQLVGFPFSLDESEDDPEPDGVGGELER